jgi:transposase
LSTAHEPSTTQSVNRSLLHGQSVHDALSSVAAQLGCDWHTVNDAVIDYGEALLDADVERVGQVDALGLDETLFVRLGPRHLQRWCTSVVALGGDGPAQLIEVVAGRTATRVCGWLEQQPASWRDAIRYVVLDLRGPYRTVFDDALVHVTQVADLPSGEARELEAR